MWLNTRLDHKTFNYAFTISSVTHANCILALEKKNVRVVGMWVCLPLRVTEVTIEAAVAGRGVTAVIQRLGSWDTRGKFSGLYFLCPYLGKHQPTLVETLTSTLLKLSDVFDKLPNVDMCFKVFSTQHPYDANKHTDKMTIEAAAAGRGVTAVIQRLGSWDTRGKFSGL
jgi:hypothetical protein